MVSYSITPCRPVLRSTSRTTDAGFLCMPPHITVTLSVLSICCRCASQDWAHNQRKSHNSVLVCNVCDCVRLCWDKLGTWPEVRVFVLSRSTKSVWTLLLNQNSFPLYKDEPWACQIAESSLHQVPCHLHSTILRHLHFLSRI